MNNAFPTYPHSCEIPNTEYILEAVDSYEFRMGAPYCNVKIKDKLGNDHIDISSWNCYPGIRASDFLKQSNDNPNILIFSVLVSEIYRNNEIIVHKLHTLKVNISNLTYRIAERGENELDISKPFYPIQEIFKLKKFLETHIHGKKARNENSKFH